MEFTPDIELVNPKVYYRLDEFYANHRTFVRSKSYNQLSGEELSESDLSKCSPTLKVSDLYDWWNESELPASVTKNPSGTIANPCGNIAKYQFTDEFYEIVEVGTQETF